MAHKSLDRIRDTSTTTGTGSITAAGTAYAGYKTFASVFSTGDTFYYTIAHQTLNEWEVGLGTWSGSGVFARTTVYASSNLDTAVNFSAGTKDIYCPLPALRTIQREATGNVFGASGAGSDQIFTLNGQTVTTNYTLPTNYNAGTFGPVTINSGVTVTIPSGSTWTVV